MAGIRALLEERKILVADGAWGTQFARLGLAAGEAPERWNLERADEVRSVAESYVEAGSDIILTNTFGGSPLKLAKVGLEGTAPEVNRIGAEISKEAAAGKALVFASVGPTGEFLQPVGSLTEDDAFRCFIEQTAALARGGADGIVIETFTDLAEAKSALRAVRESSELPAVVSMTFDHGPAGYATIMGITPEQAAAELTTVGADAVGANCGSGIEDIIAIIGKMAPVTDLPLWAKPNAGLPELVKGETIYRETAAEMAARVGELASAGAKIIGGCCGTTPGHIRLIADEVARLR